MVLCPVQLRRYMWTGMGITHEVCAACEQLGLSSFQQALRQLHTLLFRFYGFILPAESEFFRLPWAGTSDRSWVSDAGFIYKGPIEIN